MWYYEKRPTRIVAGGILPQSKSGFGKSWWAHKWIAVIESFDVGKRLGRGRSYARKGQVLSIDVQTGVVEAKVQGSQSSPYNITIEVEPLTARQWTKFTEAMSHKAVFTAKLLAGEMPSEIEDVAASVGVSLFPTKASDLTVDCSCPDYSNPCKHVAAVYYLLAETFDRDPFLLFKLRGLKRETLLKSLSKATPTPEIVEVAVPIDLRTFWALGPIPKDLGNDLQSPAVVAALPLRLGSLPFWRATERMQDALEPMYRRASELNRVSTDATK